MSGTQQTVEGRPALRFERRLDHSVERVWRAVTEPAELARWFVSEVPWTPAAGEEWATRLIIPGSVRPFRLQPGPRLTVRLEALPIALQQAVDPVVSLFLG